MLNESDNIYNCKILVTGPFLYLKYKRMMLLALSLSLVGRDDKKFRSGTREKL